MSKELVISANRHETRVALLEDDQLVEVYFQRANEYSLAGSIHKLAVSKYFLRVACTPTTGAHEWSPCGRIMRPSSVSEGYLWCW